MNRKQILLMSALMASILCLYTPAVFSADWEQMTGPDGVTGSLRDLWGLSSDDVYAVGQDAVVLHYDGSSWTKMDLGIITFTDTLQAIDGTSSSNIFIVGESGTVLHFNGTSWQSISTGLSNNLNDIWLHPDGTTTTVVGDDGEILTCTSSACNSDGKWSDSDLQSVWGSASDDIYAVGYDGTILHYDGTIWDDMTSGVDADLLSIWGNSQNNIFAVGDDGTIVRFGGSSWTPDYVPKNDLSCIYGTDSPNIFIVGDKGKIYYYASPKWTELESGTTTNLKSVISFDDEEAYAVGNNGLILRKTTDLTEDNTPPTASFTATISSDDTAKVLVDASDSSDLEDSIDDLKVRWDWENDGSWDTSYSTDKLSSYTYSESGTYTIACEVADTEGLTGSTTQDIVVVVGPGDDDGDDDDDDGDDSDDDGGPCPASSILGKNSPEVQTLCRFRDTVLANSAYGKTIVELYYGNADTINELFSASPAAAAFAEYCITAVMPLVEGMLD